MIRAIITRLREKRATDARMAALIARRAVRTCNRKPALAAKYEAVHGALARGRK